MIADADIQRAAKELVERYGDNAMAAAHERVEVLSTSRDQSVVNVALRVLSLRWRLWSPTWAHETTHHHDASAVG